MAQVLDNLRTGERIVIRRGAADTAGQLLEFDVFLQPGAHVPASHLHPGQQEQFSVLAGRVRFRVDGRELVVDRGGQLTVASGTRHWFGNAGGDVAQLRVRVRPALRMEELFEASVRCADSATGAWWVRLIAWVLIPLDFQREIGVPGVPPWLLRAVLSPLAWLRSGL
jgi:quercetin dioxygenase-like cupin family protein